MIDMPETYPPDVMRDTSAWLVSFDAIASLSGVIKAASVDKFSQDRDVIAHGIVRSAAAGDYKAIHRRLDDITLNDSGLLASVAERMDIIDKQGRLKRAADMALRYKYDHPFRISLQRGVETTYHNNVLGFSRFFAIEAARRLDVSKANTDLSAILGKICLETSMQLR
jgi:hypothetical protein